VLTATIDNKMKPAAAASKAAVGEYTKELTAEVVKTKPAARKPTICMSISKNRLLYASKILVVNLPRHDMYVQNPRLP